MLRITQCTTMSAHDDSRSSLEARSEFLRASKRIRHRFSGGDIVLGFDRIDFWIDRSDLPMALQGFIARDVLKVVCSGTMKYNARFKMKLSISRVELSTLGEIVAALGHEVAISIVYVEVFFDVTIEQPNVRRAMKCALLSSLKMRCQRQPATKYKQTWYFGRRVLNGTKSSHVVAIYDDKPRKAFAGGREIESIKGACRCLHIEWRATGSNNLARIGIRTFQDLLEFDHLAFWNRDARMYRLPRKTALGHFLRESEGKVNEVSGSALRALADRWVERYSHHDRFVMHNALLKTPNLARKLKSIPFTAWWSEELNRLREIERAG
jgi:hypothetical protein